MSLPNLESHQNMHTECLDSHGPVKSYEIQTRKCSKSLQAVMICDIYIHICEILYYIYIYILYTCRTQWLWNLLVTTRNSLLARAWIQAVCASIVCSIAHHTSKIIKAGFADHFPASPGTWNAWMPWFLRPSVSVVLATFSGMSTNPSRRILIVWPTWIRSGVDQG